MISIPSLVRRIKVTRQRQGAGDGQVYVLGLEDVDKIRSLIRELAQEWQVKSLESQISKEILHFVGVHGPIWIFCRRKANTPTSHHGQLEDSDYSWHRDNLGLLLGMAQMYHLGKIIIHFISTNEKQERGALVGLEMSSYSYKEALTSKGKTGPDIELSMPLGAGVAKEASDLAGAVNWARHLVNSPPNKLNPKTIAEFIPQWLEDFPSLRVKIWDKKILERERMGLHLAVGQGSPAPPCLIHIQYRLKKSRRLKQLKPIALVGKGITFDTGGVNIKPASNMRLMKKDMGGMAALCGVAWWLGHAEPDVPVDIYLGLAENSVDGLSFRPSDVLVARNGMTVEVQNTDAEGRLVLADVLDVAVTQTKMNDPAIVIDVATLTGAIKAGLGADLPGLFSNDDHLADLLTKAGTAAGEPNWRMPLYSRYAPGMDSSFADIISAVEGFGGAITAALFLAKFVRSKPWAHFDIYAWNDRPRGGLSFAGGSGQGVQTIVEFLSQYALKP